MSATLWIDTDKDEAIDLGPTLPFYAAFARMGRIEGARRDCPELFGVVTACELQEDVDPGWLRKAQRQAGDFLRRHGKQLDERSRAILQALQEHPGRKEGD